jgi:hypothetical protein
MDLPKVGTVQVKSSSEYLDISRRDEGEITKSEVKFERVEGGREECVCVCVCLYEEPAMCGSHN